VVHDTLFKAGRVVWCGAVGYASGLRNVAGGPDYGHNDARNMLERIISSINHCVASSWPFFLHSSTMQVKNHEIYSVFLSFCINVSPSW
jgi:hypothetical protein